MRVAVVSVVILNWKRMRNVHEICARLERFRLVDEVIVWNNNPDHQLVLAGSKTRVINTSADFGLYTRFAAASLASNDCVLFHDDDLFASEEVLEALYRHWVRRPDVCHALFGRNPSASGEYTSRLYFGPVEIVLTRYAMVHRNICLHASARMLEFSDLPGMPAGNGEDIVLSYAAMERSHRLNRAYPLESAELGDATDTAIHRRYPDHRAHRTEIVERCRKVFKVRGVLWWNRCYRKVLWSGDGMRRRVFGKRAQDA